jgi:hypothetical protein
MAERVQQAQMLAGDTMDIVFSVAQNDHPGYGGLELTLRDFRTCKEADKLSPEQRDAAASAR